jgi:hypothetical protein
VLNYYGLLRLVRPAARKFISTLRHAFCDDRFVFLVLDVCRGGDMRCNLNLQSAHRFSEHAARFYIAQVQNLFLPLIHVTRSVLQY